MERLKLHETNPKLKKKWAEGIVQTGSTERVEVKPERVAQYKRYQ